MKKQILIIYLSLIITFSLKAQTNTFPTSGNVGIGITSPQYKVSIDGGYSRGTGIKHVLHLSHSGAEDANDGTSILFTNRGNGINDYGGYIALVSSGSNPNYLNPRLDFGVQNSYTHQLVDMSTKMSVLGNGNVGIGTTNPNEKLNVIGKIKTNTHDLYNQTGISIGASASEKPVVGFHASDNSTRFKIEMNEINTPMERIGVWTINGGASALYETMSFLGNGNIGIGTTDTKGFKLGVQGKIAAEEVKVAMYTNWADFVFESNYNLPTLKEVEQHIKEKGHLKDIPSAEDVKENGIFLGEMDSKLLQKIEELTLYAIEQEKETIILKKEIETLKEENNELKSLAERLSEIEKLLATK